MHLVLRADAVDRVLFDDCQVDCDTLTFYSEVGGLGHGYEVRGSTVDVRTLTMEAPSSGDSRVLFQDSDVYALYMTDSTSGGTIHLDLVNSRLCVDRPFSAHPPHLTIGALNSAVLMSGGATGA